MNRSYDIIRLGAGGKNSPFWGHLNSLIVSAKFSGALDKEFLAKAGICKRTMERLRKNGYSKRSTINCIAKAINCDPSELEQSCRKSEKRNSLFIASMKDVLEWGWDMETLLKELIGMDLETVGLMSEEEEGNLSQWVPTYSDRPDTWRLLVDKPGSIVGHWHFAPMYDKEFELAKNGRFNDIELSSDRIPHLLPGLYGMYVTIICVKQNYRIARAVRLLFDSLLTVITDLAEEGVFFKEVCANAYTQQGVSMCRQFKMEFIAKHINRGDIYWRHLRSLSDVPLIEFHPDLLRLYESLESKDI